MSQKNRDNKNRWRNKTVAFRMSPEEAQELDDRVKLLGYRSKQEYLIEAALYSKVEAVGAPVMFYQFRENLKRIEQKLEAISSKEEMDEELLTPLRTMLEVLEAFLPAQRKKDGTRMPSEQVMKMTHLQNLKGMFGDEDET